MKLQGKNILVTGGAGFVGSHLVEELLKKKGANIYVVDIFKRPNSYFYKRRLDQRVTLIDMDITDYDVVFDLITKTQIEVLFHLAAQPIVEIAYENPRRTLDTNIKGTVNLLECARLIDRIEAIIVASSDKAYGKLRTDSYDEASPLAGDHPYDVSKSAADLIAGAYHATYGIPVVTTRFGNIYGEGDPNVSRIIPSIMESIINNTVLQLRSDGKHVRDYLYVKDVARGYILLAENIDKTSGEAFNFGSKDTYSVLDLMRRVEKTLGIKIDYKINNNAKNEIPYQTLKYEKVKKIVGWEPKYNISTSAKQILDYERKAHEL